MINILKEITKQFSFVGKVIVSKTIEPRNISDVTYKYCPKSTNIYFNCAVSYLHLHERYIFTH